MKLVPGTKKTFGSAAVKDGREKYKEKFSREYCPCLGVIENPRVNRILDLKKAGWKRPSKERSLHEVMESREKGAFCSSWWKPSMAGGETVKSLALKSCEDFLVRKKGNQSGGKTWSDFHFMRIILSTAMKNGLDKDKWIWGRQVRRTL